MQPFAFLTNSVSYTNVSFLIQFFLFVISQDEEDGDVCGDDSDAEDDNDDDDERKAAVVQDPSVSTPDKNKLLAQ